MWPQERLVQEESALRQGFASQAAWLRVQGSQVPALEILPGSWLPMLGLTQ
jgi:hypothetical protein